MSDIPGVNTFYEKARPVLYTGRDVAGAPWQPDWRDTYIVGPDEIRNHDTPTFLGVLDGSESVADWNPWEGITAPHPNRVIRYGYGTPGVQEFAQDAPLAIDAFDRDPDHGQARISGVSSIAALVPFLELPDYGQGIDPASLAGLVPEQGLPFHFDTGLQMDSGQAIGPRQVFRSPPSYSDQTAAFYAAGF